MKKEQEEQEEEDVNVNEQMIAKLRNFNANPDIASISDSWPITFLPEIPDKL